MKDKAYDLFNGSVLDIGMRPGFRNGARLATPRPLPNKDLAQVVVEVANFDEVRRMEVALGELAIVDNEHHPDRKSGKIGPGQPIDGALVCIRSARAKMNQYHIVYQDPSVQ